MKKKYSCSLLVCYNMLIKHRVEAIQAIHHFWCFWININLKLHRKTKGKPLRTSHIGQFNVTFLFILGPALFLYPHFNTCLLRETTRNNHNQANSSHNQHSPSPLSSYTLQRIWTACDDLVDECWCLITTMITTCNKMLIKNTFWISQNYIYFVY
jgi:hypothetical protein